MLPPKSKMPETVVIAPAVERRSLPPTRNSEPPLTVIPPPNVFWAPRERTPLPVLVSPKSLPEITPPNASVPTSTFKATLCPKVIPPVPRFRLLSTKTVKSPFHTCALFVAIVTSTPEVFAKIPPLIVSVPRPSGEPAEEPDALRFNRPSLKVTPPVKVLAPLSDTVPEVVLANPCVPANSAEITPLCPTNAIPVEVKVPFCTKPPLNVTVPEVD